MISCIMHMPVVSQWSPVAGQVGAGGGDHMRRRIGSRRGRRLAVAGEVDLQNNFKDPDP